MVVLSGAVNTKRFGELEIGIHWLQGVCQFHSESKLINFAKSLDETFQWRDISTRMGKVYDRSGVSFRGVRVGYSVKDLVEGFFLIPGSYLDELTLEIQSNLLHSLLLDEQLKLTRIDIAFNDYTKRLTPNKLHSWAISGYMRGFRRHSSPFEDFQFTLGNNISLGITKTFGRRSSKKFLRVYEALPIHCKDAIRWELELRDDRARAMAMFLHQEGLNEIPKYICGAIDFVDSSRKRSDRCGRLKQWDRFVDYCGGCEKFSIPHQSTSFDKKVEWLFRQCSKNLAIAREVLGDGVIQEMIEFGKYKFDVLDEDLIKYSKQHF
ncbi:MAG: replication initiation factor domain-containing protein [Cyanobacteriota bacterium]|nr:replication initiation factor domain-containing protein [Cyanobacteriota bacterium]